MAQNKVIATCSIEHELRSYLVSLPVKEKKNKSENHFHKLKLFFPQLYLYNFEFLELASVSESAL